MVRTVAIIGALLAAAPAGAAAPDSSPISAVRMNALDKVLASASFEGRAPGTPGEARTIAWLVAQLKALGLEPAGPGGSWTQPVPLVRTQLGVGRYAVRLGGKDMPLVTDRDIYVSTVRPIDRVAIAGAPMVFVGYGVAAPERKWDDFKDVDLKGKIAVFLVNDPDFEAAPGDDSTGRFGGKRMTYYGRWTYKYEEAARRGAIGALIVHDTPGAGYGWETVTAPHGENYDVAGATGRLDLQGWLKGEAAETLFRSAGLNLAQLRAAARRSDFRPVELKDARFSAEAPVKHEALMSHNMLAKISGRTRPREVVMYGAHWDAYGIGKPDARGKTIRSGANDDALGVAGLLEIARAFRAGPRPARSVMFGFWSAEERGLLGSETYALHPTVAPRDMVANITLDILQTGGPSRDVMLVGQGQNSLEQGLAAAAGAQGRTVTPEALPERGLFYRADHFSLAKRGVPTLLFMAISGAPDLVAGGRPVGEAWLQSYMKCYHQTCDEWRPDWNLAGAAQDVALAYRVGRRLADSSEWPTWSAASEFRVVREQSRAVR
ncbi:MAG: M20/M25/M40 family metallo-hydrolase [Sphingomicrobium sp.]